MSYESVLVELPQNIEKILQVLLREVDDDIRLTRNTQDMHANKVGGRP